MNQDTANFTERKTISWCPSRRIVTIMPSTNGLKLALAPGVLLPNAALVAQVP